MNSRLSILLLSVAICGLAACTSIEDNTVGPVPAAEMCLYVNGEHYDIALPATEAVDLRTLNSEFEPDIRVENADAFESITVSPFTGIAKDKQIEIAYTIGGQSGIVRLNALHSGIPDIVAEGKGVIPGDFYLSFIYQRLIMKYDNDGQILYYRYDPTLDVGTFKELGYWDFKKHVFDGKTYYSFHAPDDNFADRAFTGYDPGMRVLLDDHYVPVDTIHALPSRDGYLKGGEPLDGHDFYFFSPTHWIASASYVEREVDGKKLAVGYLQEVKDGEVVFDWWSSDHKEMAEWGSPVFDTSYDYVHFNSVQVLPDDNWLCSFRALSSLLKIDHETGDILWRINGEALADSLSFYGQHYATLHDDNTLTLFDNGNGHDPQLTRVLRLNVDPETGEVSGGGDMLNPGGNYFTQACGAVQLFSGDRFTVGWGWSSEAGNNTRLVSEHDAEGRVVFALSRSAADCMPNSVNPSYRCVKYE